MSLLSDLEKRIADYRPVHPCPKDCVEGVIFVLDGDDEVKELGKCRACSGAGRIIDMSDEGTARALLTYSTVDHEPQVTANIVAQAQAFIELAKLGEQRLTNRELDGIGNSLNYFANNPR